MNIAKTFKLLSTIVEGVTPFAGARIVAAITYKNELVSIGIPSPKTDPFQARFASNPDSIYPHAEVMAIKKALKEITIFEMSKSTLLVCRIKGMRIKTGIITIYGNAKPCRGCQSAIAAFEIPKVFYTVESAELKWERL
jgi:tRNA(Arg) A34 adenosine deaminase TadA